MDATEATPPIQIPSLRSLGAGKVLAAIAAVSAAVLTFLVWLIYFKPEAASTSLMVARLPAVNASLNALSATFLIAGYVAIRRRKYAAHTRLMLAALLCSSLFLAGYVVYHHYHGDTKFTGTGPVRPVYFFVLISHIVLSAVALPMILTSFYLSLAGKLRAHRAVSRYTLPIWLYVSVTGVLVFAMLRLFNGA